MSASPNVQYVDSGDVLLHIESNQKMDRMLSTKSYRDLDFSPVTIHKHMIKTRRLRTMLFVSRIFVAVVGKVKSSLMSKMCHRVNHATSVASFGYDWSRYSFKYSPITLFTVYPLCVRSQNRSPVWEIGVKEKHCMNLRAYLLSIKRHCVV